ncbi:ubiquitin-protein ligase [Pseudozyma hubeiensis SY62]|uniref:Ubiquitin-protein ligase n=1 Tax=Pseudozyma hubeiensis (strain SY62) TaxID=1305764 RepID=R9PBD6_PSEHS|nr:ubiquitin-protein ligase [Pseudozyma hubeiensis SY62]GAC95365.1 ubiquitin-protein ligase [Pseudozyma hubeiensis SY62]
MKITKTPKRLAPAAPEVLALQDRVSKSSDDELPAVLDSISEWCWPRGDLYYWTGVLNRFDTILENVCRDYELSSIQANDFTPLTKRLVASILRFSRLLVENCTNRKLYSSFEHLNELLYTRDLDVLEAALRLVLRAAQQHSSHHPRHEFQISKERLTTLAMIWTPRDHGVPLVDVAQPEKPVPSELSHVRFQFFQRCGSAITSQSVPSSSSVSTGESSHAARGVASPHPAQNQHHNASTSTPTRSRNRDHRPVMLPALSTGALPVTPTRQDDRVETNAAPASASGAAASRREGLVTVDLGKITSADGDPADLLAKAVETYGIPQEERFELFQRIRLALGLQDAHTRRQLLVCRLLAIACYGLVISESIASTQLFLYEPDLIQRIAALVDPVQKLEMAIQSSAFYALDSLGRYRNRVSVVLNSVNASVNHGIILSVVRNLIDDLRTDAPVSTEHYVDSVLSFVAFIATTSSASHTIVGAGLVPLLVELVNIDSPDRYMVQRTVSRALGLIDSLSYAVPQAFDLFCNARGLDVLVDRIKAEVDRDIHDGAADRMGDGVYGEPGPDNLYGRLSFGRASLLRSMFKTITQMMSSTGTGDGLRNLVNTSLPDSLKRIILNRNIFGPQILALVILITSTIIHNEPTSLTILQEAKIPEVLFDAIEADIEAHWEVIYAIPNAIGAICLNQAGLDLFNSRRLIPKLFSLFTSERHSKVFQDRDNANAFGAAIDELMRHQPSTKPLVMDSIMRSLDDIGQMASTFELPQEPKARAAYGLLAVGDAAADGAAAAAAAGSTGGRAVALADVVTDEPDPIREVDLTKIESNPVITAIDVVSRFLEGLFQTSSHCKDFIKMDGLDKLLSFYSSPCLPYDFSASLLADSLVTLIRLMAEISPSTVLIAMLRDIKAASEEAAALFDLPEKSFASLTYDNTVSRLLWMATPRDEADAERATLAFRKLVGLCSRAQLFTDVCTITYVGHKLPSVFLQTLVSSSTSGTISLAELGAIHRACAWENMLLKTSLPPPPPPPTTDKAAVGAKPEHDSQALTQSQSSSTLAESSVQSSSGSNDATGRSTQVTPQPQRTQQHGVPNDLLQDLAGTVEQRAQPSGSSQRQEDQPSQKNAAALRYVASQIPSSLTALFVETVRYLAPRRSVDAVHKSAAYTASVEIAKFLKEHLTWRESSNSINSFAFATLMICQTSCLLFDERPSPSSVQPAILRALDKHGGLDSLFDLFRRYVAEIDRFYNSHGSSITLSGTDMDEAGIKLGHTCGGLKVALGVLLKLTQCKGLIESTQTTQLVREGGKDVFEPHAYLAKVRLEVLNLLLAAWDKPWLPTLPASVNRLMLQNLLTILRAQNEAAPTPKKTSTASGPSGAAGSLDSTIPTLLNMRNSFAFGSAPQAVPSPVRRPPNEERVRTMVDMGFPEGAARHALSRCQNNLNAATEYLLSHDDLVVHYRDNPSQSWNGDGAAGATAAQSGDRAPAESTTAAAAPAAAPAAADDADVWVDEEARTQSRDDNGPANADVQDTPMADAAADNDGSADTGDHKPEVDDTMDTDKVTKVKADLDERRTALRASLVERGLELADHHPALVFEVKSAILLQASERTAAMGHIEKLVKIIDSEASAAFGAKADFVALRMQLLALVLHDEQIFKQLDRDMVGSILTSLEGLIQSFSSRPSSTVESNIATPASQPETTQSAATSEQSTPDSKPKWLASLILALVGILGFSEDIAEVKPDDALLEDSADGKLSLPGGSGEPSAKSTESAAATDGTSLGDASAPTSDKLVLPRVRVGSLPISDALFRFVLQIFREATTLERNDLLAAFRLLTVLTRNHSIAARFAREGGVRLIFEPFRVLEPKQVSGCQPFVALVLRHIVEDSQTLAFVMAQEIHSLVAQSRNKTSDTSTVVRQLDCAVLRDPDIFLESAAAKLEMTEYSPTKGSGHVKLVQGTAGSETGAKESPSDLSGNGQASLASLRLGDDPMDSTGDGADAKAADEPGFFKSAAQSSSSNAPSEELDSLMAFMLTELLRSASKKAQPATHALASGVADNANASTASQAGSRLGSASASAGSSGGTMAHAGASASEGGAPVKSEEEKQDDTAFFYSCFLMQCLTELLSSYSSCKTSFVNFSKKRLFGAAATHAASQSTHAVGASAGVSFAPGTPGGKEATRSRAGILSTFLCELVPAGFLSSYGSAELRKKMTLSNWAMSVLVALTADVSVHIDIKEVPADLITVRKIVLDSIARSIKEAASSSEPIEVRYGRLYALSDLCYRLLIARPNSTGGKQTEDLTLHMAKTMLEKNFVTVLTSAIADVDLNLPTVKSLLEAILRPLEHLTKVSIKMGKAKDKTSGRTVIDESEEDSEFSSDYDMEEDFDDEDEIEEEIERQETPDFYRNSSLGMHTGEMETGLDDDEMSDEDTDDDEDEMEMEDFDSETGSELSTDEELEGLDGDDPHIMELTDSDTDMGDSSDEDSDLDDDDHAHSHGHGSPRDDVSVGDEEDGWTTEEEEMEDEDDFDDEDDEALDFIFEGGEDGMPAIPEEMGDEHDVIAIDDDGGDGLMDDEEIEMLEEDSMDDPDDMSQLELAEEYATPVDDRFGANWGWTAAADSRPSGSGIYGDRPRTAGVFPPNFFLPNAIANMGSGTGGHRRRNLLDFDSMMAPRRTAPPSEEISSHPLLVDQSDADANRHAGRGARSGSGGGQLPSGYADWAQSVEEFVGEGALQFLENLLSRGGAAGAPQGIRIELGDGGRMRIDGIDVSGRLGRGGPHHLHHHHHSHTQHGQAVLGGDAQRATSSRQAAQNDPVTLAQSFTPMPTLTRWSEEALILLPSSTVSNERTSKMRNHLINALLPGFRKHRLETRRQLEQDRKALEQAKETREQAEAEIKRLRESRDRMQKEFEERRDQLLQDQERAQQMVADGDGARDAQASTSSDQAALNDAQHGEDSGAAATASADNATPVVGDDVEMADAETAPSGAAAAHAEASTSAAAGTAAQAQPPAIPEIARATIFINGEEIDITDTGIDPTFLEALPDDLREEVLNQHFRERRAAEATSNLPQPTSIAPEFLDALPPELRAEVIQQEALEVSRRRIREEMASRGDADRQSQSAGGQTAGDRADPATARAGGEAAGDGSATRLDGSRGFPFPDGDIEEMLREVGDTAFGDLAPITSLGGERADNGQRQHRRFEDEEDSQDISSGTIRGLPGSAADRLGAMPIRMLNVSGGPGPADLHVRGRAPTAGGAGSTRDGIQLLDKSGVATLVRLLFFPQMNAKQTALHKVLANLCENLKTRSELLNLLLMVLAEGSVDAHAVDRSFVSMSNRANRIHSTPSRPTPKRANSGPASAVNGLGSTPGGQGHGTSGSTAPLSKTGDEAPFLIASRSIDTLLHLTSVNTQAALWFLRNDARPSKRAKGKEKERETDASERGTAPINVLLGLLSKETILGNSQLVDSLLALISSVTKPLYNAPSKADGEPKGAPADGVASAPGQAATSAEMTRSDGAPAASNNEAATAAAISDDRGDDVAAAAAAAAAPSKSGSQPKAELEDLPTIPADRLCNLVKPLTTALSSKGFQHTLWIAAHVNRIDGARETICSALQAQANTASRSLVGDLDALLSTLPEGAADEEEEEDGEKKAGSGAQAGGGGALTPGAAATAAAAAASAGVTQSGIVISGPTVTDRLSAMSGAQRIESRALATLASPTNAQAVLLRSLRALNYIMTGR